MTTHATATIKRQRAVAMFERAMDLTITTMATLAMIGFWGLLALGLLVLAGVISKWFAP